MQSAVLALQRYWAEQGCMIGQPLNTEVGAGTMNPATFLRVLGPEPWRIAYVEPSVRPDDSRYGENPNRLQTHTQFQVILKPEPGDPQELFLGSLAALGVDPRSHDIRFVEDNWAQPAIGAWGLGWEVWIDGMEATQFTYFQQVGGHPLDPVSVEITYGMERILMALQGVSHFRDLVYAPGITYGEIFGESEYEMSRYYLDAASVERQRNFYQEYIAEAERLIAERLPVPAHLFVLKSSQAFNILDSRGAISTTERAQAFGTMRRLAREISGLWIEKREQIGFPLLAPVEEDVAAEALPAVVEQPTGPERFVLEIGVEELPAAVVGQTVAAVHAFFLSELERSRLDHGTVEVEGTPRRIVVAIAGVAPVEREAIRTVKGPRSVAAFDAEGRPTRALEGFTAKWGLLPSDAFRMTADGAEVMAVEVPEPSRSALEVLGEISSKAVLSLRAERNMRWSNPALSFSRPIRWLVALLGAQLVEVNVPGLASGRTTRVFRSDSEPVRVAESADGVLRIHREAGIVLSVEERRTMVREQAADLAASAGAYVDLVRESTLIDEVANLVEAPFGLLGNFPPQMLELPACVLEAVMHKHLRYLAVRDDNGDLAPAFIAFANGKCDEEVVRRGNEAVIRARFEDALFFWRSDLQTPLDEFYRELERLTFETRLGSMRERAERIKGVAGKIAEVVGLDGGELKVLRRAAEIAKFDLATKMVIELSSLAGEMAAEYARRAGEVEGVVQALLGMELPRTGVDELPPTLAGAVLALADRADLLVSMAALGEKTSGSSDPFGQRRAAIGIVRILRDRGELQDLGIRELLTLAAPALAEKGFEITGEQLDGIVAFVVSRLEQLLRIEGADKALLEAFDLSYPGRARALIAEVEQLQGDPAFLAMVQAMNRVSQIVPADTVAIFDPVLLASAEERRLVGVVSALDGCDTLTEWAATSDELVEAVAGFFDAVLIMDLDDSVRSSRLGLLRYITELAPSGVRWKELWTALFAIRTERS